MASDIPIDHFQTSRVLPKPKYGLLSSIPAAIILAAVTLGVFYNLQDFGPVSTIRKFNVAVGTGDADEVQKLIVQPVTAPASQFYVSNVRGLLNRGADLKLARFQQNNQVAIAVVAYTLQNASAPFIYVLVYQNHTWLIDIDQSLKAMQLGVVRSNPDGTSAAPVQGS